MTRRLYDGDEFERGGKTFRVTFPRDEFHEPPWESCDGHGPVTGWERREKAPGELILCEDRSHKRFYDFQAAVKIARRDGWGFRGMTDADREKMPRGEIAARAARDDYEFLRRWCADLWEYVGCIVTLLDEDGEETDETESLWGIESESEEYLAEIAEELADEILARVRDAEDEENEETARALEASRADMYESTELRD